MIHLEAPFNPRIYEIAASVLSVSSLVVAAGFWFFRTKLTVKFRSGGTPSMRARASSNPRDVAQEPGCILGCRVRRSFLDSKVHRAVRKQGFGV